jgi:hypothetical protein
MVTYPVAPYQNVSALVCDITLSRQPYVPNYACVDLVLDWNITFQFGTNTAFTLNSRNFTYSNGNCYFNFANLGYYDNIIIGQAFISEFYTIFDTENSRIGLGISANTLANPTFAKDGPWITNLPNPLSVLAIVGISAGSLILIAAVVGGVMFMRKKNQSTAARNIAFGDKTDE